MHCKAQQFGQTAVNIGNRWADKAAREAVEQGILALVPVKQIKIPNLKPKYSKLHEQLAGQLKASQNTERWWVTPEKQVIITPQVMLELAKQKHAQTHWGVNAMVWSSKSSVVCVGMTEIIKSIVAKCPICLKNNPLNRKKAPLGVTKQGNSPGDYWQVDFSELPRQNRFKYLLVLIDTFSGWPDAFPCHTNNT